MIHTPRSHELNTITTEVLHALEVERTRCSTLATRAQDEAGVTGLESVLRRLVLGTLSILGVGYILVSAPVIVLLGNAILQIPISSQQNITVLSGRILFLMAAVVLVVVGVLLILSGVQFYERNPIRGVAFLSVLLSSLYLLCLGVGATLLLSTVTLNTALLILSPILTMIGASAYMLPSRRFQLVGSVISVVSGILLAIGILGTPVLDLVFGWGIPFNGPFMSMITLESVAVVLGPTVALVNSAFSERREHRPLSHIFLLMVALVYGVGLFIGSLILSFSFWDLIWKSPWTGPFYSVPHWVMSAVTFWSASLVLLDVGGIVLIGASCLGFVFVAREYAQL